MNLLKLKLKMQRAFCKAEVYSLYYNKKLPKKSLESYPTSLYEGR
jgi:hypothetical protein